MRFHPLHLGIDPLRKYAGGVLNRVSMALHKGDTLHIRKSDTTSLQIPTIVSKTDGNLPVFDAYGNLADSGSTPDSVGGGVLASHKSSTYRFNESGTGTVAMPNSMNDVVPAYFQAGDYDGFSDQKFYFEAGKVYRINLTTRRATINSYPTAITVTDDLGNNEILVVTYSMTSLSGSGENPDVTKTIKPDRDGYWELVWVTRSIGMSLSSDFSYFQVEEITYTTASGAGGGAVLDWSYDEVDTGLTFFDEPIMRKCFTLTTGSGAAVDVDYSTSLSLVQTAWVDDMMALTGAGETMSASASNDEVRVFCATDGSEIYFRGPDSDSDYENIFVHVALHYVYDSGSVIAIAYLDGSNVFVYALDGTNQNVITNQGDNGTSNDMLLYACRNIEILATQTPTVATPNSTEYIYTLDGTDGTLSEVQTSGTTYTVPADTYAFILRSDSQISAANQTAIEAAPLEMVKLALGETSTISGISTSDIAMYVPGRETVGAIFDIVDPFTARTYSTATYFNDGDSQATMTPITGGARVEIAPGDEGTGVCTLILADISGGTTSGDRTVPVFTVTINSGTLRIDQALVCGGTYNDDITTDGTYTIFPTAGNGGSNITLEIDNTAAVSVDLVMVSASTANVIECANATTSQHDNADEAIFGLPDFALERDSLDIVTATTDTELNCKGTGYGETQARTYTATVTIDLTPTTVSAMDLLYTTGGTGTISVDGSGNVTASSGTVAVDTTTLQAGVRSAITVTGIALDESSKLFDGFDGLIHDYTEVS